MAGEVAPYQVIVGNPAKPVRARFAADVVLRLQELCWWDWPIGHILRHEAAICGAEIDVLEEAARELAQGVE